MNGLLNSVKGNTYTVFAQKMYFLINLQIFPITTWNIAIKSLVYITLIEIHKSFLLRQEH